MYIKVIDSTNNFKSSYKKRIKANDLEAFLSQFNFLSSDKNLDLFIFPDPYFKKEIIINLELKTPYNYYKIKIIVSGLTDKTFKKANKTVLKTFYKGA